MRQLRYAVFVFGFVILFAVTGCAGRTTDLAALTPESGAETGEATGEATVTEGGEVTAETGTEMGPVEPTVAGEAAMAEPTVAGEAVAEPTVAATSVPAIVVVTSTAAPAQAATTAPTQAATTAPTQAAAAEPTTAPAAAEPTGTQSQIITISEDGSLLPQSVTIDPGTRLSLTLVNLSSSTAMLMVNFGNASSGIIVPAATQDAESGSVTLSPQEMFVQFDEAGTFEMSCSQGCTGSIAVEVGGGTAEPATEDAAATPTE